MIQCAIHRFRYWFLSAVVLVSMLVAFTGTGTFSAWERHAHAQARNASQSPACIKQACDNVDPIGRCDQVDPGGGCLNAYPLGGAYTPTANSCAGDNYLGARMALLHPKASNINLAVANITIDGQSSGERIASVRLMYSDTCGTNWLDIIPLGRCLPQAKQPSPCNFNGWMQRSPTDKRNGDDRFVYLLPTSPQATAYSAMLWAPDAPVQGCASASYPNQLPGGGTDFPVSPFACVTQQGF
jgi:hypothetical protein